jgi:hypothetical protein
LISSIHLDDNQQPASKEESLILESLRSRIRFLVFALAVAGLIHVPAASAQTDQGRIAGTVHDISGAVISGATVTVKNERTGEERTVTTNEQGNYTAAALKPSVYGVKATLDAFAPAEVTGIQLVVGQRLTLDLTVQPAGVAESITVETAAEATLDTSGGAFPIDPAVLGSNFANNPNNRQYQPRAYSPDYQVPERVYQYSFSVQQELPGNFIATAAYVGSKGRNLFLRNVTNRIVSVQTNPDPAQNAIVIRQFDIVQGNTILRPFAEIDFKTSGGRDSYNALQVAVVRRSNAGLTLNSQYTFGKSWGNTAGSNEALTAGNPFDYNYDIGYNNFDVRHTFNTSAVYALPLGRGRKYLNQANGLIDAVLGGWEIGTIVNARSGLPIDMRVTRPDVIYVDAAGKAFSSPAAGRNAVINTPGGGSSRNVRRPDLVPGVDPYLDADRAFLNPAAFAIPKPGVYGNLVRNQLHGPNFRQMDLMLNKRFQVTETTNFDLRTEVFNLFNVANFKNPPATLPNALGTGTNQLQPGDPFTAAAAGTFGIMNTTVERTVGLGTNRQIQFALRFNF